MVTKCQVTNKSVGPSIYTLSTGFTRFLAPLETRTIDVSELEELMQVPGGRVMIENFLQIHDPSVVEHLLNKEVESEYWLKSEDIPAWMNSCSLEEFKDALEFAPLGTLELIKTYAVQTELNDYSKRQAILEQLGFNVNVAIEAAKSETPAAPAKPARRTTSTVKKPIVVNKPATEE